MGAGRETARTIFAGIGVGVVAGLEDGNTHGKAVQDDGHHNHDDHSKRRQHHGSAGQVLEATPPGRVCLF